MARTIFVGDVHGCRQELEELLAKVGLAGDNRLVLVGDLVARGPDSAGVLALVEELGAAFVRGNHEEKLLSNHLSRRAGLPGEPLSSMHRRVARSLGRGAWKRIADAPLWLDLPDHDVRVVHAGVVPGVPIEHQARSTLLTIRALGPAGEPLERPGDVLWGTRYEGPQHIVFGHFARPEPQLHPHATGIDTGCVYGGELTALVLREGERVPPMADRLDALVRVRARRRWFGRRR